VAVAWFKLLLLLVLVLVLVLLLLLLLQIFGNGIQAHTRPACKTLIAATCAGWRH
jgi:hypothetical protein